MEAEMKRARDIKRSGSEAPNHQWQPTPALRIPVTLLSLTDDSILRIGAMLVEEYWEQRQRTAFLKTYNPFTAAREAKRWKRTSADDTAGVALWPLLLANRRLRQVCKRLLRKSIVIRTHWDLAKVVEAGPTARAVRFLLSAANPITITQALDTMPNVTDVVLYAAFAEFGQVTNLPPMQLMLALGTIHAHRLSPQIRSIQLYGGPFERSESELANLHPFSLGCLATFKNLTSLSLRTVIKSTGDYPPVIGVTERFAAQLNIAALCPSLRELDLLVSPPDWKAPWSSIRRCEGVKRLTLTSVEEGEVSGTGLAGLLSLFPQVEYLELRLRSPVPDMPPTRPASTFTRAEYFPPGTLRSLQELRISGTTLSSALKFVKECHFLRRLHLHDDHKLFCPGTQDHHLDYTMAAFGYSYSTQEPMAERTLQVLEIIRQLKAHVASHFLRDLTLHVHRRQSPSAASRPLDEECEELLEGMVGKACSLMGVKYTLVIHP